MTSTACVREQAVVYFFQQASADMPFVSELAKRRKTRSEGAVGCHKNCPCRHKNCPQMPDKLSPSPQKLSLQGVLVLTIIVLGHAQRPLTFAELMSSVLTINVLSRIPSQDCCLFPQAA